MAGFSSGAAAVTRNASTPAGPSARTSWRPPEPLHSRKRTEPAPWYHPPPPGCSLIGNTRRATCLDRPLRRKLPCTISSISLRVRKRTLQPWAWTCPIPRPGIPVSPVARVAPSSAVPSTGARPMTPCQAGCLRHSRRTSINTGAPCAEPISVRHGASPSPAISGYRPGAASTSADLRPAASSCPPGMMALPTRTATAPEPPMDWPPSRRMPGVSARNRKGNRAVHVGERPRKTGHSLILILLVSLTNIPVGATMAVGGNWDVTARRGHPRLTESTGARNAWPFSMLR